jgi:hypothetical protein
MISAKGSKPLVRSASRDFAEMMPGEAIRARLAKLESALVPYRLPREETVPLFASLLHHLGPLTPAGAVVLPFEDHAGIGDADQATVGDRDAVGVARQIGQHRLGPAERALAIDDPFGSTQWRPSGGLVA